MTHNDPGSYAFLGTLSHQSGLALEMSQEAIRIIKELAASQGKRARAGKVKTGAKTGKKRSGGGKQQCEEARQPKMTMFVIGVVAV